MVSMLRASENQRIALNSGTVTLLTYPTRTDSYGNTVPDHSKTAVETSKTDVRITTESSGVEGQGETVTPRTIMESKYLVAKYDNDWLIEGLKIGYKGKQYQTDIVQNNIRYDEIINKVCRLIDLTEVA